MGSVLLFASGGGSNVNAILDFFRDIHSINFPLLICNNQQAGVIDIARSNSMDVLLIDKPMFENPLFLDTIDSYCPKLIVLAGFLWKLPSYLVEAYPNRIVNIHPSLLPAYGGKGMYGHHVHEAVIANKEKESGLSIHLVNEHYDEGRILLQKKVTVEKSDTPFTLQQKILQLEHQWYPQVIQSLLQTGK